MGLGSLAQLLGAAVAWRTFGVHSAGRTLARALGTGQQEKTLAGMALVRAGGRSVQVIEQELKACGKARVTVHVLADIGTDDAYLLLARIATGRGAAADLARDIVNAGRPPTA